MEKLVTALITAFASGETAALCADAAGAVHRLAAVQAAARKILPLIVRKLLTKDRSSHPPSARCEDPAPAADGTKPCARLKTSSRKIRSAAATARSAWISVHYRRWRARFRAPAGVRPRRLHLRFQAGAAP